MQPAGGVKLASLISVAAGASCDLGAGYTVAYWVFIYAANRANVLRSDGGAGFQQRQPLTRRAFFSRILGRAAVATLAYHADVEMSRSPKADVADSAWGVADPGLRRR